MIYTRREAFKNFLRNYDLFATQPEIYFAQKRNFGTIFGTFISLIFITIIMKQALSLASQVLNETNPQLQGSSNYSTKPIPIYLDQSNFSIGIGVYVNGTNIPLNNSLFGVIFSIKNCPKTGGCINIDLGLQKCNQSDLIEEYFTNQADDLFCPANQSFKISGRQLREIVIGIETSYLEINVVPCQNGTAPGISCLPQNEIDTLLNSSFNRIEVYAFFTNQYFYPSASQPVKTFLDFAGGSWPLSVRREMDIYVDYTYVQINNGIIFNSYEYQEMYSIDPTAITNQYMNRDQSTSYFRMNMRRSPVTMMKSIDYMQLADAMSLLGGFAKTVFFVFSVLLFSYNREKFKVEISNTLYNFPSSDKKNKKEKSVSITNRSLDDSGINIELFDASNRLENAGTNATNQHKIETQKFEKLKFTCFDWFKTKFCPCYKSPYHDVVSTAYGLALRAIDIAEIIKKIQEIDKLKEVLLNEEQQKLFEYIPKKVIKDRSMNPRVRSSTFFGNEKQTNEIFKSRGDFESFNSYLGLFTAYEALKLDPNPENKKLIKLLSHRTIKNFEEISLRVKDLSEAARNEKIKEIYQSEIKDSGLT